MDCHASTLAMTKVLDATRLLRPTTVVRDRSNIGDQIDIDTGGLKDAHGGIVARAGAFDEDIEGVEIGSAGFLQSLFDDGSSGEGGRATGALEAASAGGAPADDVTGFVGKGDVGGVEGGLDVHFAVAVFEGDFSARGGSTFDGGVGLGFGGHFIYC